MTKPCVVPQCKTGSRSIKTKVSVFKVPSNSERLKKWQSAIPEKLLTASHYVCERHFEEQYILRKYIKHDADGKVIAEVAYKHPRLKESAIPTIFDTTMDIEAAPALAHSSSSGNEELRIHATDIPISNTPDESSAHPENSVDCVTSLPEPWVAGRLSSSPDQRHVFLYPQIVKKHGIEVPITAKTVTVDRVKNVRYFVHGKLVDDELNLQRKLDFPTDLPNILTKFANSKMCCGIGEVNINFLPAKESLQDYTDGWHHKKCSLLSKKRRCENCSKLRKHVLQKVKRMENLSSHNRISRLLNPVDDQKLRIIKKKMKCERRGRNRAKSRLSILQNSFKA